MNRTVKKIDTIILVILIVASTLFLYKAGYINPFPPEQPHPFEPTNTSTPPEGEPSPPTSFIPSSRRDVSAEDEGVHYNALRINREWWYFSAILNGDHNDLPDWVVQISFNHMARSDLLGTNKPDLLLVTLQSPNGSSFGGIVNKQRGLNIITQGTLIASSPGVNVQFVDSWAEGQYPDWHVHAEGKDVEDSHDLTIDLDYHANALPIWVFGTRVFDESNSPLADYAILGCTVTGKITFDGKTYTVSGQGHHEHAWAPNLLSRTSINGWDWFRITLQNGWSIYANSFYPTPEKLSSKTSRINPFSTVLLTTDNGVTFTELKNVNLKITDEDSRIFPFVKMPSAFTLTAEPSLNPLYLVSQSLLYGTKTSLNLDISSTTAYNKVWKFPAFVGMKTSSSTVTGSLSWSDTDGNHDVSLTGVGVIWSMRALL
jgi:predicted secreted hydrolase